jgi:hypothetical protein
LKYFFMCLTLSSSPQFVSFLNGSGWSLLRDFTRIVYQLMSNVTYILYSVLGAIFVRVILWHLLRLFVVQ